MVLHENAIEARVNISAKNPLSCKFHIFDPLYFTCTESPCEIQFDVNLQLGLACPGDSVALIFCKTILPWSSFSNRGTSPNGKYNYSEKGNNSLVEIETGRR